MVLILISIPLLTSCSTSFTAVKPLGGELYSHPSGIVTLPYPKGWAVEPSADSNTIWLHPEDSGSPLRMVLIAEVLPGETEQALLQTAQTRLESYLREILPNDDYEIYNTAEIRVERNPALLLDIARPVQEGYQVGRIVLVYLPGHLVFLAGLGEREAWEVFLPTFRAIVEGMRFSIQPFPFDDE